MKGIVNRNPWVFKNAKRLLGVDKIPAVPGFVLCSSIGRLSVIRMTKSHTTFAFS